LGNNNNGNNKEALLRAAVTGILGAAFSLGSPLYAKGNEDLPAPVQEKPTEPLIKCVGVNDCKLKGHCGEYKKDKKGKLEFIHNCKSQNSCKGKSFLYLTKNDCAATKKTKEEKQKLEQKPKPKSKKKT